jgi:hypothetical protein
MQAIKRKDAEAQSWGKVFSFFAPLGLCDFAFHFENTLKKSKKRFFSLIASNCS